MVASITKREGKIIKIVYDNKEKETNNNEINNKSLANNNQTKLT